MPLAALSIRVYVHACVATVWQLCRRRFVVVSLLLCLPLPPRRPQCCRRLWRPQTRRPSSCSSMSFRQKKRRPDDSVSGTRTQRWDRGRARAGWCQWQACACLFLRGSGPSVASPLAHSPAQPLSRSSGPDVCRCDSDESAGATHRAGSHASVNGRRTPQSQPLAIDGNSCSSTLPSCSPSIHAPSSFSHCPPAYPLFSALYLSHCHTRPPTVTQYAKLLTLRTSAVHARQFAIHATLELAALDRKN